MRAGGDVRTPLPLLTALLAACSAPDPVFLADGPVALHPAAGDVAGLVARVVQAPDLVCPDGQPARIWEASVDPVPADGPVAVVFHPGAYDWVDGAPDDAPLQGVHYAAPSRLDVAWASREVFAVLGQWPSADPLIDARGALAVALADRGVTLVLPANCWGDLWHDTVVDGQTTGRENDETADGFARDGFALARLAWEAATDPGTATDLGLTLPSTGERYLVGQGTGGRAVSELLQDGAQPDAAALDATPDDLRAYIDGDPTLYGDLVAGLPRIFPSGTDRVDEGALWSAPLPPRLVYAWSERDPAVPVEAHLPAVRRLGGVAGALTLQTGFVGHVATASDPDVAGAVAMGLLGGGGGASRTGRAPASKRVDGPTFGQ